MEETSRIITEGMEYIIPTQRYNEWPSNEYTVPASAVWYAPTCDHKIRGVLILKSSDVAMDGSSKLVEHQVELPFVPTVGTLFQVGDCEKSPQKFRIVGNDSYSVIKRDDWKEASRKDVRFLFRVVEMLWDVAAESFRARCEVVDGGKYETWEDAKDFWSEL